MKTVPGCVRPCPVRAACSPRGLTLLEIWTRSPEVNQDKLLLNLVTLKTSSLPIPKIKN